MLGNPAVNVSTNITSGSDSATVTTTTGLSVGQTINGGGIPAGTTITAIDTGSNTVTLSANATATNATLGANYYFANTYTGGTSVTGGTIQLANPSGLGTAAATFASGTTLDINNFNPTNALTVSGTGVSGNGVITNTSGGSNPTMSGTVALAANATFDVPHGYVITGVISGATRSASSALARSV